MLVFFQSKNILTNLTKVCFIVLFSFLFSGLSAQNDAAAKAEKKKKQIETEQQKKADAALEAAKKHHFDMQTKKVQKRMKEDERKTDKYYNKKLGHSFFSKLFGKKKRKMK